jgi:prepilin signal peptidase PulO-like enzyme (type II secretory pathway)
MDFFLVIIAALIFGSFASLLTYRLASGEKIALTRSKCLNCGLKLKAKNLIPLISWLFQKGKCSNCKNKISLRYPLIELSFLLLFALTYFVLQQELNPKTIFHLIIVSTLIVMVVVDLEHYFIPNSTQYFLAAIVTILLIYQGGNHAVINNIPAAFLYAAVGCALWIFFYFAAGIEAIGIDDIKFFFIAGLALGLANALAFMLLSGIIGIIFGSAWKKIMKDETFPFAPSMCLAFFFCLIFDKKLDPIELMGSMIF